LGWVYSIKRTVFFVFVPWCVFPPWIGWSGMCDTCVCSSRCGPCHSAWTTLSCRRMLRVARRLKPQVTCHRLAATVHSTSGELENWNLRLWWDVSRMLLVASILHICHLHKHIFSLLDIGHWIIELFVTLF